MALAYIQPIQLTPAAAGGVVRVYLAGTTDIAPTYNPVTGELSSAPLSIDSAGICEGFHVDTANSYDLKVYKANGSLYLTRENLASLGGGSGTPGPQGPQGIRGEKGDRGDTGAPGANGTNGTNGANGVDGDDGVSLLTIRVDSDSARTVYYTLSSNPGLEIPAGYIFPAGVGTVKTDAGDPQEGYLQEKLEAKDGILLFTNPNTHRIEVSNTLPETYKVKAQETSETPNFLNSVLVAGPNTTITPSTDGNSLIISAGGLDAGFNPRGAWVSTETYGGGDGVWYYDAGVTPVVNRYYIATTDAVTTNPYTDGTGWVIMFSIDQQGDMLAKLDAADPVTGYLLNKFEAGTNITFTRVNDIAGDKIVISATGTGGSVTGTPWRIASFDNDGNLISNPELVYDIRDNLALGSSNTIGVDSAMSTLIGHNNTSNTNDAFVFGTYSTITGGGGNGVAYAFGSGNRASAPYGMAIGYDVAAGLDVAGETVGVGTHITVDGSEAVAFGQHQDVNGAAFVTVGRNITDESLGYQVVVGNDIVGASAAFPNAQFIAGAKIDSADVAVPSGNRAWTAVFGTTDNWIGFFGKYCDQRGTIAQRGNMLGFDANNFLVCSNELTHADYLTSATQTADRAGRLVWDADDKTLSLGLEGGSALQLGQEELVYAVNRTGSPITNGSVVYISGSQGNRVVVSLAQAILTPSNQVALAVATQTIADNQTGYFTRFGLVRNINTSAWAEGTILYVGTTAGAMVGTAPAKPYSQLAVGIVTRSHATVGMILVSPYVVPRIGQLTDVSTTGATDGQALVFEASSGLWKPGSTASSDGKVIVQTGGTAGYLADKVKSSNASVEISVVDDKLDLKVDVDSIGDASISAFALDDEHTSGDGTLGLGLFKFNKGSWVRAEDGTYITCPSAGVHTVSMSALALCPALGSMPSINTGKAQSTGSTYSKVIAWADDLIGDNFDATKTKIVAHKTGDMHIGWSIRYPEGYTDGSCLLIWQQLRNGSVVRSSWPGAYQRIAATNMDTSRYMSETDVAQVEAGDEIQFLLTATVMSAVTMDLSFNVGYMSLQASPSENTMSLTLQHKDSTGTITKGSYPVSAAPTPFAGYIPLSLTHELDIAAGDRLSMHWYKGPADSLSEILLSAALVNPVGLAGGSGTGDGTVKVAETDTAEFLGEKILPGTNITVSPATNSQGYQAVRIGLDLPEQNPLFAGKCRRYQKVMQFTDNSFTHNKLYVVGKTSDDWAFTGSDGKVIDMCGGAFAGGYNAEDGAFSLPREGIFSCVFSAHAFVSTASSYPVYFYMSVVSSYDNFVTYSGECSMQMTLEEPMTYQENMDNFTLNALVNNVADGLGRYKKIKFYVNGNAFSGSHYMDATFRDTYVSINEVANPQAVQGPKGDKGDQGSAGEATLDGLLTFPIILSNTNISTGHTSDQGATYASSRVIAAASVEATFMSCFFTQVGTFYGLRMGIYTPGPAGDTLIAQTDECTMTPALGICTMPLTRDGAGNPLTETLYLDPNTSYMPAVVIKANATNLAAYEGISTNPPNHFGRQDGWNAPAPTNLMPMTAAFSQSNTFPWLAISK